MARNFMLKIPRRLLLIYMENAGGAFHVPFPKGETTLTFRWDEWLNNYFQTQLCFIFYHPDSKTAVLAMIPLPFEKSCHRTGNLLVLDFYALMRVSILDVETEDNKLFAHWEYAAETKPSRERFLSNDFQAKVNKLNELLDRFIFGDEVAHKKLPPHEYSEETIGSFIDRTANAMNVFSDENGIEKFLLAILAEDDIEKRLDKTIELLGFCIENVKEWGKNPAEKSDSQTGDEEPAGQKKKEPKPIVDRDTLVRQLLIDPAVSLDTPAEENPAVKESKPDERGDLIRKLILDENKGERRDQ